MKQVAELFELIQEEKIEFVDLRFTDLLGAEHHLSLFTDVMDETFFSEGKPFDGSSLPGWKSIQNSDMLLLPDLGSAVIDPFCNEKTINLRCNILDPETYMPCNVLKSKTYHSYDKDPRSIASHAEQYLISSGIADACLFGPEIEFFLFDQVHWQLDINGASYRIDSEEGCWNSANNTTKNLGHRPRLKQGYLATPPIDSLQAIRSEICLTLRKMGLSAEAHHHEVATGSQSELTIRYSELLQKADELQTIKYVIRQIAHRHGKTATFMPKPLIGDNGSGMHCHQSLKKSGTNLFSGNEYSGLSQLALYYVGGILKHARAINAFTNATTNSYKRLVPGFEAPVTLGYSANNRSASIRVPFGTNLLDARIEVRFPDMSCNPYLAFAAMLMAGIDGIKNHTDPGEALEGDLYQLPQEKLNQLASSCYSLEEALNALDGDRDFLLAGQVFSNACIDSYIQVKRSDIAQLRSYTHPFEFELYYSC